MPYHFEKDYALTFGHIDNRGISRPSALFDFMQDAATDHAESLRIAREDLHAMWVLSRLHCSLVRPLCVHEIVRVKTWCAGIRGATWMRAFALYVDDAQIGQALSTWAVLDPVSRRILRPANIPAAQEIIRLTSDHCPAAPGRLTCTALMPHHVHTVRYSDLDINGHMNNVKTVDVICDGLELERRQDQFVSEIQVNYTAECMPGDDIMLSVGASQDGLIYVFGAADEKAKFESVTRLSYY